MLKWDSKKKQKVINKMGGPAFKNNSETADNIIEKVKEM